MHLFSFALQLLVDLEEFEKIPLRLEISDFCLHLFVIVGFLDLQRAFHAENQVEKIQAHD